MTDSSPYSNLLPGKLWKAERYFVGIDVELQKQHELSQKYYGKPQEILLVLDVNPANFLALVEERGSQFYIQVRCLVGNKIVLLPWYSAANWREIFSDPENKPQ